MDIIEVLDGVASLLQQKGRLSYRIVKMQFQLDDEQLEVLKEELLFSHPEIVEVDGRGLVWNGAAEKSSTSQPSPSQPQSQPPSTNPRPTISTPISINLHTPTPR